MKKLLIISLLALSTFPVALPQQYGWIDISRNLPDFPNDTLIFGKDTSIAMMRAMYFLNDLEGWITPSNGPDEDGCSVLHTIDGGETWEVLSKISRPCNAIHMLDQKRGYAGGQGGIIWKTMDGGKTWTFHATIASTLMDIEFPPQPADTGYASGMNGVIAMITPAGSLRMESGIEGHVESLSFPVNRKEGWFEGEGWGMVRHYINGSWVADQVHTSGYFNSLDFVDNQNGWLVGDRIIHTSDGKEWVEQTNHEPIGADLMCVSFISVDQGCAAGFGGQVFQTSDGGESWRKIDLGTDVLFQAVQLTSPTNGYLIGQNKAFYKYTQISAVEEVAETKVVVFPNPASAFIRVQSPGVSRQSAVVALMTLEGKCVLKEIIPAANETFTFDVSHLSAGVYFCRIVTNRTMISKKIVIIR